jgi:hypothetical protein
MRQCPTCRKIYPKTLGDGNHCSARCRAASQINSLRAGLRLERLAHWLKDG